MMEKPPAEDSGALLTRPRYSSHGVLRLLFGASLLLFFGALMVVGGGGQQMGGGGADVHQGSADVMNQKTFGSCVAPVRAPLRWGSSESTGNQICCHNRDYAEYFGYWRSTDFPFVKDPAQAEITFYDSVTGHPLFVAPRGRSYEAFIAESRRHGWPSFRDQEVIWPNVLLLPDGETVSINGTHLGHNLPDSSGNRYCINIVCVAAHPPTRAMV